MGRVAFVVGGFGFLGRRLVDRLLRDGWRVGVVDPAAPHAGDVAAGGPGSGVVAVRSTVDAAAVAELRRALGPPSRVFQLGGSGSVGAAERDPALDRRSTVDGTAALIEAIHDLPEARLVLVSSAAVYGEGAAGPLAEDRARAPISVYGRHKAVAEDLAAARPNHAIVRLFSLYGPTLRKQLLWDACHKLRGDRAAFAGSGTERRDWVHVDDAVDLLERAAASAAPALLVKGGTGNGTPVARVGELQRATLGGPVPTFSGQARAGDPHDLIADPGRARGLGWSPTVTVEEGIVAYARWFEAQAC